MNIGNINNSDKPDKPTPKIQEAAVQKKNVVDQSENKDNQKAVNNAAADNKVKDVFVVSKETKKVLDLTTEVMNMPETPREDLIAKAQERIQSGFYNTADVARNAATKMLSKIS